MADIMLEKPLAGVRNIVDSAAGSNITLGFPIGDATLERSGNDLVFHFEDGSSVVLREFYSAYTKDTMPDFVIEGAPVSGEEFFTALNGEDLMPAAGPAASAANAAGGRYHEFTSDPLQTGVERLGGLDLSSDRAFYPERDPWGGAREGDSTVLGDDPSVTPDTPVTPDVPEPLTPNTPPVLSVTGGIGVIESGVHPGGNVAYAGVPEMSGAVTATDADADSLHFGLIDADGNQVSEIVTDYGALVMNPDGTYTYTLDNADPDTNSLALGETREETFTVFVDDGNGGVTTQEITVTIVGTNDIPTLELSTPTLGVIESGVGRDGADNVITSNIPAEENAAYAGRLTSGTGQAQGADVDHGAVLTYGAASGSAGDPLNSYFTATDSTQAPSSVTAGGTYGDLTLNNDGSYSYTLHPSTDANLNSLHEGETVTETFTVYVKDEHGAWSRQELTVNITGTNDRPEISAVDSLVLKESGVQDGGNTPTTPDGAISPEGGAHRLSATGHVTADDVDNDDNAGTLHYSFDNGRTSLSTDLGDITIDQNGDYTYTLNDGAANTLAQGETRTETFTVTVTDSHGATHEAVINVTIYGTNDIPTLTLDNPVLNVYESGVGRDENGNIITSNGAGENEGYGGSLSASGTAVGGDADHNASLTYGLGVDGVPHYAEDGPQTAAGEYGTLTLRPDGGYTYTLFPKPNPDDYEGGADNPDYQAALGHYEKVDGLSEGESHAETFTVYVRDEHGAWTSQTLTVNVVGTNDQPHIDEITPNEGDHNLTVKEEGVHEQNGDSNAPTTGTSGTPDADHHKGSVSGTIHASDPDKDNGSGTQTDGSHNHDLAFSVIGGTSALNGGVAQDIPSSGLGGDFQHPTYTGPAAEGSVSLHHTITTDYGTLNIDENGNYTYTLKDSDDPDNPVNKLGEGERVTETFTVQVMDKHGATHTETITVTVEGTNDIPTLELNTPSLGVIESGVGRDETGNVITSNVPAEENTSYEGKLNAGGNAVGGDVDNGAVLTYGVGVNGTPHYAESEAQTAAGAYGDLTLNPDGSYSYTLHPATDANLNSLHEGEVVTETFTVYVKDEHGAWTSQELTVNITGTNDRPEISHVDELVLKESGVQDGGNTPTTPDGAISPEGDAHRLTATGHVSADDADNDDNAGTLHYSFADGGTSLSTELGSITIDQNGDYTYTLKDGAADSLAQGETRTETITVMVTDSHGATHEAEVNVTIYGTNDQPTLSVTGSGQTLTEANPGEPSFVEGTFEVSDPDNDAGTNQTYTIAGTPITVDGKIYETTGKEAEDPQDGVNKPGTADDVSASFTTDYGKLVLDPSTGKWKYELDNNSEAVQSMNEGDVKVEHFTVTVTDEHGATSTQDITVTIRGTNDAPYIAEGGEDLTVREAGTKDDGYTGVDVDPGQPTDGSFFTVKDVDSKDTPDTLRAYILDAKGEKLSDANGNPIEISAGETVSVETAYGRLTVSATATDGGVTYDYSFEVDNDNPIVNGLKAFDADDPASFLKEHFQISVEDGQGGSVAQNVDITIQGTNDGPTVTHVGVHVKDDGVYNPNENPDGDGNQELTPDGKNNGWVAPGNDRPTVEGDIPASDPDAGHTLSYDIARDKLANLSIEVDGETINIRAKVTEDGETRLTISTDIGTLTLDKSSGHFTFALDTESDIINGMAQGEDTSFSFQTQARDEHGAYHQHWLGIKIEGSNDIPKIGTTDSDGNFHEAAGPIALDVTESGVGRDAAGNVVDKPGTSEENAAYTDHVSAGGKVAGFDVDRGHILYFGASKGDGAFKDAHFNTAGSTADASDPVTVVGDYGTLTLQSDGTYTYTLGDQDQTFEAVQTAGGKSVTSVNNLNEGDTITETFTVYVKDEHNAWSKQELTVTVTGTNDAPVLAVAQGNDRYFNADGKAVDDKVFTEDGGVTTVKGRVSATDADEENGSGAETTATDHHGLTFSLTGGSSTWKWGEHGSQQSDGMVSSDGKTIITAYGTLTIDEYGEYTYTLNNGDAVQKLGAGESVTETFTVRVMDERGAWSEQKISFTVNGSNDRPSVVKAEGITVYEQGVWGDQVDPSTDKPHGANDTFGPGETQKHTGTVTISDVDAHDTHSLVFAPQAGKMTITYNEATTESTFYVDASGVVWGKVDGLKGVGQEGAIRLGTLTGVTNVTGNELHYTFNANYQGNQGLDGLPQGMELSFGLGFKVTDQRGLASETSANITIIGTNDKPTITHEGEVNLFVDGVGRTDDGSVVKNKDNQLNPEENKFYTSKTLEGKISGTDSDLDDKVVAYHISNVGKDIETGAPAGEGHEAVYMVVDKVRVGILDLDTKTGDYTFRFLNDSDGLSEADFNTIKETLAKYSEGEVFTRTVTFQTVDTHDSWNTKDVDFKIYATNDKPEIALDGTQVADGSDVLNLEVTDRGDTTDGKTIAVEDADKNQSHTFGLLGTEDYAHLQKGETVTPVTTIVGEYGTLIMNPSTGKYEYKLDSGNEAVRNLHGERGETPADTLTETFYVTVRDSAGAFDTHPVTITIKGTDDAPVFETHNNAYVHDVYEAGVERHSDNRPIHDNEGSAPGKGQVTDADAQDQANLQISLKSEYTIDEEHRISGEEVVTTEKGSYIIKTDYGTLTLTPGENGAFTYTFKLDNDSDVVNALPEGATLPLDFTISAVVPGEGQIVEQPLRIYIHGTNDRPFFTTGNDEHNALGVDNDGLAHINTNGITVDQLNGTVKGKVTAWDHDADDAWSYSIIAKNGAPLDHSVTSISGKYGTLSLNAMTGDYTYTLRTDLSEEAKALSKDELFESEQFTIRVTDKLGAYSDAVLKIDIMGVDDPITLTDSTAKVYEDAGNVAPSTSADIIAKGHLDFKGIDNVDKPGEGEQATFTLKDTVKTTSHPLDGKTSSGEANAEITTGENGDQIIQGKYGTLTLHADGTYEYKLKSEVNNGDLQKYGEGEKFAEEVFNVTATSGKDDGKVIEGTITINILGSNDTPVIETDQSNLKGSVTLNTPGGLVFGDSENEQAQIVGQDTDANDNDTLSYGFWVEGKFVTSYKTDYGTFQIDPQTGKYTYTVDNNSTKLLEALDALKDSESLEDTVEVVVRDQHGAVSEAKIITITINKPVDGSGEGGGEKYEVVFADGDLTGTVAEDAGKVNPDDPQGEYGLTCGGEIHAKWVDGENKPNHDPTVPDAVFGILGDDGVAVQSGMPYTTEWGTLYMNPETGHFKFVLNNKSEAVQKLAEGDSKNLVFTPTLNGKPLMGEDAQITITIKGTNDVPKIESADTVKVYEKTSTIGKVTATDLDIHHMDVDGKWVEIGTGKDADSLSYGVSHGKTEADYADEKTPGTAQGQYGTLTINADGTYTYTLTGDKHPHVENGKDGIVTETFTVWVKDEHGAFTSKEITVEIKGENNAPTIVEKSDWSLTVREDNGAVDGTHAPITDGKTINGSFVTDDSAKGDHGIGNLSFAIVNEENGEIGSYADGAKGYGSLTIDEDGKYTFRLNNESEAVQKLGVGETAEETFTIRVTDAQGESVDQTITVTIQGTNDAPELFVDSTRNLSASGGDALVSDFVTGTITGYDVDEHDTLTYTFKGGKGEDGEATYTTDYGTFTIVKGTDGNYTYKYELKNDSDMVKGLKEGELHHDKATIQVSDGHGGTAEREITVTIKGANDAPELKNVDANGVIQTEKFAFVTGETHEWTGQLTGSDADGDTLTYALKGGKTYLTGKYGTLEMKADGTYTYKLTDDLTHLGEGESPKEPETFTVTVSDGHGGTTTATLNVNIMGTNDAPEIKSSTFTATNGKGEVTFSDVDTSDTHTLTFDGLYGSDGKTALSVDTAHLPVGGKVDVYNAEGTLIGTLELTYTQGSNDQDKLQYTFVPNADYANSLPVGTNNGPTFTVKVSDGIADVSDNKEHTISVTNQNDAPEIATDTADDDTMSGTLTFTDADVQDTHTVTFDGLTDAEARPLSVDLNTQPASVDVYSKGTLVGTMTLTYLEGRHGLTYTLHVSDEYKATIKSGESKDLSFTVNVADAHGGTVTGSGHTFEIAGTGTHIDVPAEPGTNSGALNIHASGAVGITVTMNGETLTLSGEDPAGTLDGVTFTYANGKLSYEVDNSVTDNMTPGASGASLSFSVKVSGVTTDTRDITLNVESTNTDPIFGEDQRGDVDDHSVSGTLFATDHEGQKLTYAKADDSASHYGTLELKPDGSYTYTLTGDPGEAKTDSFTVTVSDGHGGTATKTLTFDLGDLNAKPVFDTETSQTRPGITIADTDVSGTLMVTDDNGDNLTLINDNLTTDTGAVVTASIDKGVITYIYTLGDAPSAGTDSFTLTVSDGYGGSAAITVNVTIDDATPHVTMFHSFALPPLLMAAPDSVEMPETSFSASEDSPLPGHDADGSERSNGEAVSGSGAHDVTDSTPADNHGADAPDASHMADRAPSSDENGTHGPDGQGDHDGVTHPGDPAASTEDGFHTADGAPLGDGMKESSSAESHASHALGDTAHAGADAHTPGAESGLTADAGQDGPEAYSLFAEEYDVPLYGPIEDAAYGDGSGGHGYYGDDATLANIGGELLGSDDATLDGLLPGSSEANSSASGVEALDADPSNGLSLTNGETIGGPGDAPAQMPGLIPAEAVVDHQDIAVGVVTGTADAADDNLAHTVAIHQQQNGNG